MAEAQVARATFSGRMARGRLLAFTDGSLEALKWIALVLMTGDHVNRFLLSAWEPALHNAGRIAMPLFAIVLAINLARPAARTGGAMNRTMGRLLLMGSVATVPYMMLEAPLWNGLPLNILFTLALGVIVIQALNRDRSYWTVFGVCAFVLGGLVVEFWWLGLAMIVGTWLLMTKRRAAGGLIFMTGTLSLCLLSNNYWALLALPLVAIAAHFDLPVRRYRAFFYVFYPAHLAAIYLLVLTIPGL